MRRNLSSRDPHHGDMEHFQQEQPVLTSENKSQPGFGSEQNDKTVSPFLWILETILKKIRTKSPTFDPAPSAGDHLDRVVLPLEGRWETQKMVPFDVRKMMFFFVPRISFENQSFPELVGRSIEKPSFYYKTDRPKTG